MDDKCGNAIIINDIKEIPQKKRKCTDILCLSIFVIVIGSWFGTSCFVIASGNIGRMFAPVDHDGRKCGYDSQVIDRPYLLIVNLKLCYITPNICLSPQLCVDRCPTTNFMFNKSESLETLKSAMICAFDINVTGVDNKDELEFYISTQKCARWYTKSIGISGYCVPNSIWEENAEVSVDDDYIETAAEFVRTVANWSTIWNDIVASRYLILLLTIGCGALSILYVYFFKWDAMKTIIVTLIILLLLICYLIYLSYVVFISYTAYGLISLIVFCCILVAFIFLVSAFRKRILAAVGLIKEAGRPATDMPFNLVFPVFAWIIQILLIVYCILISVYAESIEIPSYEVDLRRDDCLCPEHLNYTDGKPCIPEIFHRECRSDGNTCSLSACRPIHGEQLPHKTLIHILNAFAFYWLLYFPSGLSEFVLAGNFLTWCWSYTKTDIPLTTPLRSFWKAIRYHLGTIAFGSILLTILDVLCAVLELANNDAAGVMGCILSVIVLCFEEVSAELHSFISTVNQCIFITSAAHGTHFVGSIKYVYRLIKRNALKLIIIDKVVSWILLACRVTIAGLAVVIAHTYCNLLCADVHHKLIPLIPIAVLTYLLATSLFTVYNVGVNSIILCCLEDDEQNDGSSTKPYYTSSKVRGMLLRSTDEECN